MISDFPWLGRSFNNHKKFSSLIFLNLISLNRDECQSNNSRLHLIQVLLILEIFWTISSPPFFLGPSEMYLMTKRFHLSLQNLRSSPRSMRYEIKRLRILFEMLDSPLYKSFLKALFSIVSKKDTSEKFFQ